MKIKCRVWVVLAVSVALGGAQASGEPQSVAELPEGVRAVWDAALAHVETTSTRERLSINGLWRWQPTTEESNAVPVGGWGYFKVPGCWPGITDYMQKDSQIVYAHPDWKGRDLRRVTSAWYQREITVPARWAGRRISLRAEYLNSFAAVYVDGRKIGELRFPAGEVELGEACRSGETHVVSLFVVAMPLRAVLLSYSDTASAKEVRGSVARRGLCGDVDLVSTPAGPRIRDVKVDTSVREGRLTLDVGFRDLAPDGTYRLHARIRDGERAVREFTSTAFRASELEEGRARVPHDWKADRLWDLHTPANLYQVDVSLLDDTSAVLDVFYPQTFGFRELWIDGRDFYLNGSRIHFSVVPLDNAQVSAALASYAGARESLQRLKDLGINLVYTHNYGCEPGSHLSFAEVLRAADDVGMLVSLSQPHFSHYRWDDPDADDTNGYARHAEFYVRVAQNHPSVVLYGMSHNATGYMEDMNPDLIDGVQQPRDSWSRNNARRALRAEAIVRRLDRSRIVYHHSSGNLSSMHTSNFYANFVPSQEICDWFEHWATRGVKPVFLCEYGVPLSWDWTMYRGWYRGERAFGSASVPWELCISEWNAQFFGDRAYEVSEREKRDLRWEARQFRADRTWHRWDYPVPVGSSAFAERQPVYARYITDEWRAFRTWGVSAFCPWDHGHYWTLREGVDRRRKTFPVDWENLQRPGFSPDFEDERYQRVDLAFERSDWAPSVAAEALLRNNRPLLAYIGGKPARFTSRDHNFHAGETVEKQLIVINDSRETVTARCEWSFALPRVLEGHGTVRVKTGDAERLPLRFALPAGLPAGVYELSAAVTFEGGETQRDSFSMHVVPPAPDPQVRGAIALFDPRGETAALLRRAGVRFQAVEPDSDLSPYSVLFVGKAALTVDGAAPDITRVREGLNVVVFEQTPDVLEKRFGFRVAEYGLRQVFKRVPDHPVLAGLSGEHLRDWRGDATILPPRLSYRTRPRYGPTVDWCGIPVTRAWRCGCYGNVASVLIEKPARGDFLPIVDGGFSLRYSPLMEYREGRGVVLFCQMDVTGRTDTDPAAELLARNLIEYMTDWKRGPERRVMYVGERAGRKHLERAGIELDVFERESLSADHVLIAGPSSGRELAGSAQAIAEWLEAGGRLLAIGLDGAEANLFLPLEVQTKTAEYISAFFEPREVGSLLSGLGPADLHNRDPRELPLVTGGAAALGGGVLAAARDTGVVFCQLVPWQFDPAKQNQKRVYRRASFVLSRLLGNLGAAGSTPILRRFGTPASRGGTEKRWLEGLYVDVPEEWDDPYRFFRW